MADQPETMPLLTTLRAFREHPLTKYPNSNSNSLRFWVLMVRAHLGKIYGDNSPYLNAFPVIPPYFPESAVRATLAQRMEQLNRIIAGLETLVTHSVVYQGIRRKVFISHYKGDRADVDAFIDYFANQQKVFLPYALGANDNDDFINSTNTDYVMTQIRTRYLQDTTVTIVLVGHCTHSRRYVDWEIKSSLRQGTYTPNGLLGIILPSRGNSAHLPPRLERNWTSDQTNCYARYWVYPRSADELGQWIEDAYNARTTRAHLINNPQDMMGYNARCKVCGVTH